MAEAVIELTDETFEKETASDTPVLVDFWAPWCGPCRTMGPLVEKLAEEMGESVRVCKLNTDENPETPQKLGVTGIPTFMVFKKGEMKWRHSGTLR